ncbi:MAG: hypothetical protein COA78_31715 [Blastopirellula sp.]|nr:MAG: hypothetical protein COA78_31715 [Blastopirellula sp.]
MRFFIAGIMQGSHLGSVVHTQDYRTVLKQALLEEFPDADVYDPWNDHQNSLEYGHEQGRDVFLRHNQMCGEVDVVVAFVPEASMGTGIEMWEAFQHNKVVLTISPLKHNWAIKFLSNHIYATDEEFLAELKSGHVAQLLAEAVN